MLSESDAYLLKKFRDQNMDTRTDMIEKKVLVCYDSNSGGYNGEIIFDLSSLGVASDYLDYGNAFITVPYVCSMKGDGTADISSATDKTTVQPKDGFHHLLDSMSIEINGRTVQSIQNFSNMFYHMKYLMSASAEDALKNSATTGVFGESVTDYAYNDAAGANGIGYSPFGVHGTGAARYRPHSSLIIAPDTDAAILPWINPSEIKGSSAESYYSESGATTAQIQTWLYYYTIKLSHISSFFENLALTKATDIKLIIKYNSFSAVITAAASTVIALASYTQLSGRSCPLMLCPLKAAGSAAGNVTMTANVVSTGLEPTPFSMAHKQCRLYVPSYKIRPDVASAMITSFPQTKVQYFDIYSYSIPSIPAGGQITYNLTNGVTDPVFVMVLPFQRDTTLSDKIKGGQYQSIFDSAPATTSGTFLKDLQIQVGGKNTFQLNETYSYDQFINEFSKFFALNGNSTLGVTSGLINQASWNKAYRCYVADISRRELSEHAVSKAVVLTGYNASAKACELICFVAYRKSLTLNTATGIVSD